jgi:prepilin-type N-terminal cleavage/methylation domain-containing protein
MNKLYSKQNKGFTLIETLIAISIFTTSIVALMSISSQGIKSTIYAKQKILATYLAQEGIEYVRNIRDTYVLYGFTSQAGWDAFNTKLSNASCMTVNGCYFNDASVDYASNNMPMTELTFVACTSSNCANGTLLYDSSTGKYGFTSGSNSKFSRQIVVTQPNANETKMTSTIYWTNLPSSQQNVSFSESLFNWVE